MKTQRNILSTVALAVMTVMLSLQPVTASAATTSSANHPEGYAEVWGTGSDTYKVGEAFRAKEVGLCIYQKTGDPIYYQDNLEFWANGNAISDGYKFQELGEKIITVKRFDKQAQYVLQVVPPLNGTLKECYVSVPPAKTAYRQSADAFDPKNIVVTCVLTNGTTQNLGYQDLEFYAGSRGMANHKSGVAIKEGYRFKEAGDKDLIIKVMDREMRIPFTVTPYTTKEIAKVEMTKEPSSFNYKVGEGFRASEYAARCFYADGTTEDVPGSSMNITANGVQIYEGYKFKEAGKKELIIHIADYSTTYQLTVSK